MKVYGLTARELASKMIKDVLRQAGITATAGIGTNLYLFTNYETIEEIAKENAALEKERKIQDTVLSVHKKYGINAFIKGINLEVGATTIERNNQIGGHKK